MTINPRQRNILKTCGVIVGLMLLFPPFVTHLPNGVQSSEGYSFLLSPPKVDWSVKPSVNTIQLFAQWFVVCLIGGIGIVLSGQQPSEHDTPPGKLTLGPSPQVNETLKVLGPILRIGRGLMVIVVVLIGMALLSSLLQMCTLDPASSRELDWGKLWALLLAKVLVIAIILMINRALKAAINRIYRAHRGRTTDVIVRWRDL